MRPAAKLTEAAFTDMVINLALLRGWKRILHVRPARTARGWRTTVQGSGVGFPDIVAIRMPPGEPGTLLVAELKVGRNKTTPDQDVWLDAFRSIPGALVFVWRPENWNEIERVLEHGE